MEIADVFVVNKHDLPGGNRVIQEVSSTLELAPERPGGWLPPVLPAVASRGSGISELYQSLLHHRRQVETQGMSNVRRLERARFEVESIVQQWSRQRLNNHPDLLRAVASGTLGAEEVAQRILGAPTAQPARSTCGRSTG